MCGGEAGSWPEVLLDTEAGSSAARPAVPPTRLEVTRAAAAT